MRRRERTTSTLLLPTQKNTKVVQAVCYRIPNRLSINFCAKIMEKIRCREEDEAGV
jgi:hypothetical protein